MYMQCMLTHPLIQVLIIKAHKYVYSLVREGEISEHTLSIQWATYKSSVEDTAT